MMQLSDAVEGLKTLDDKSVDLVITDPAYDSIEKWRSQGTTTRLAKSKGSSNEWFPVISSDYYPDFFSECFRVLKRGTHLYVFCDAETFTTIRPYVAAAGFVLRKPLIWYKRTRPMGVICPHCSKDLSCRACGTKTQISRPATSMGYPYRATYEMILFAIKGKRKPPKQDGVVRDVLEHAWIKSPNAYPTEKPVSLIEVLIQQSSFPDDLVVDPFAGSGSTLVAAQNLGRKALGFDINPKTIDRWNGVKDEGGGENGSGGENEGTELDGWDDDPIGELFG